MLSHTLPEFKLVAKTLLWNLPFILIFIFSTFLASMQGRLKVWMHMDVNKQHAFTQPTTSSSTQVSFISLAFSENTSESFNQRFFLTSLTLDSKY